MSQETAAESTRLWVDASGNHKLEAVLLGVENGKVRLGKSSGSEITVPLEKLSLADQQYIRLPADPTIWPNRQSYRNSDPWLVENHDRIRVMRPRLLVINFSNNRDMPWIRQRVDQTIKALAESTRYHGFADPRALEFVEYEVAKYIDMRDVPPPAGKENRNSSRYPRGARPGTTQYAPFYSNEFAQAYGFTDPAKPDRYLNLHELINTGLVHELWFYGIHDDEVAAFESVEFKQFYDDQLRPIRGKHGPAGNGHPDDMPWSGRSFRITWFNTDRGLGCGMENFGHALEGVANSGAIPYYKRYFDEFAEFDLDKRYPGFPVSRLYGIRMGTDDRAEYPDATTLVLQLDGKPYTINNYVAMGGNVHFPPGARGHYDLASPFVVKTVIENYRLRNGVGGKDAVHDFDPARFRQYERLAPDCMGPWMIYWRQCMPGYGNRCVDDHGKLMKNWWVFLFY
ncbi:MAG: hypothetical protein JW829_05740 [Pirellulales bacterium]|nr:hypothetical protein [Pirellulales bacterium]